MRSKNITIHEDAGIVNYIAVSVKNHYIKLSKQSEKNKLTTFTDLSESQKYYIEKISTNIDDTEISWYFQGSMPLTNLEQQILVMIYEHGYSVSEVALCTRKTRQAVNQMKKRALKKLQIMIDINRIIT